MCIGSTVFGPKPLPEGDDNKLKRSNSIMDEKDGNKKLEFNYDRFEKYITGDREPAEFSLSLRSQNEEMSMPIMAIPDLISEFMTAMSLNHGCIRVLKRKKPKDGDENS